MKRNGIIRWMIVLFAFIVGMSCADREKIDLLSRQNQQFSEENTRLKEENIQLKNDLQKLQTHFNQLNFLAKQLKGVKARIITNMGNIELEFYPDKAPLHCFTFITRAESGFYDNTQFHRVIPGFMIQGGDPKSKDNDPYNDGTGGPLVNIPHEFNDIHHGPGILSTARVSDPSVGAGCQFFIMHGDAPQLDKQYTVFGKVTRGMDVVDKIANVNTYGDRNPRLANHPVDPVIIRRIEVYRE